MNPTDGEVVRAVRRGDREAFGELVRTHQGRLFGLVLMMVRQPAAAEEVTQDAFIRAYLHLDRYDDTRPFYPWLAAIAVRLSQNWLRHNSRTTMREGTALESAPEASVAPEAPAALAASEAQRQLWNEVRALPSGERTAVLLFYRDNLAIRDVARALAVTTGTVKTLLFRARRHLRNRLESKSQRDKEK